MAEEILVNHTPLECRVALVENGVLQECFIERSAKQGLVGNIYLGKVVRVLPGMQAAFIDIGLSRTAFLHLSDLYQARQENASANIRDYLQEGQRVPVQVVKDMLGTKGARLTTDLALPSRYLVYMPYGGHVGVSQRIECEEERTRLREEISHLLAKHDLKGGIIIRTAAETASHGQLKNDLEYLVRLWAVVQNQLSVPEAHLVFSEIPLPVRVIRDYANHTTQKILIDSREIYNKAVDFSESFTPYLTSKIEHYPGPRPIFDLYSIEDDLKKALNVRVDLKSGGYLIIDQTEAMTTIDVNTGSFVSGCSLEDTVYRTNLEATQVIARQLRLRNLGGIIIVDFIDMLDPLHQEEVLANFKKFLSADRTKTSISNVSPLGLVEMTRKRTADSLERVLCEPCPSCSGRGYIKTAETISYEIMREVMRYSRAYESVKGYKVIASSMVIDRLMTTDAGAIADLEHFIQRDIKFQAEPAYAQDQYDIVIN